MKCRSRQNTCFVHLVVYTKYNKLINLLHGNFSLLQRSKTALPHKILIRVTVLLDLIGDSIFGENSRIHWLCADTEKTSKSN